MLADVRNSSTQIYNSMLVIGSRHNILYEFILIFTLFSCRVYTI